MTPYNYGLDFATGCYRSKKTQINKYISANAKYRPTRSQHIKGKRKSRRKNK